jgi:hypothetical protein
MPCSTALVIPLSTIHRCDRWQVRHRLQELGIPSHCLPDGSLHIEVHHALALIQVQSVIQRITAPRQALIHWLNRCWQASDNT